MTGIPGQVLAVLLDSGLRTWGTREDLWLQFSQALISRGVRPVLVFSETPVEGSRNRFRASGVEVEAINYGKGVFHYYRELGKVVRKYSVTGVHIAFFNYFSIIPWLARLRGVSYIVYHERNPGVLRAKSWEKHLLRLRSRAAALPMTRVIAISDFLRRQLIEVGIPAHKIFLVHHGVDTQRYSPDPGARGRLTAEFAVRPNEIILAVLCKLMPHKNIDVVLEACSQLAKCGIAGRLFVVGDGPMRAELEGLGHRLGIADCVHWLGHIPDPVPILQACDVFLMVSTGEGFGLALAEAMACGAAAVASRSGAHPEIVEDGATGLLVPPRDASALADAIQKLAQDEWLRRDMGLRGLERVRQYFTAEVSTGNVLKLYESMWSC
jgi:glycosyltransferase involved in cell wall biosynthesis